MRDPLSELSIAALRRRRSAKWATYDPTVLPLWVAEMDVPLAPSVRDALGTAIADHDTGYATGPDDLHAAYAGFAAERWGWDPPPLARTRLVADVMTGAVEALRLVARPGDAVVIDDPVYPPFRGFVEHADRTVVTVPLGDDGRLSLDALDRAFAAATAGGRAAAYLLCNPHNPVGTLPSHAELTALAATARHHGVRVVADEIHAPLALPGRRFVPYLSVPGSEDAFAVVSASKGWSLAGIKAALLMAGEDAAHDLTRLPEVVGHGANHLGVVAHTAAFATGGPWLDAVVAGIARNATHLRALLADQLPTVAYRPGAATYLAWLDCRALALDDPAAAFLRAGVALSDGAAFGPRGAGHVRCNLAAAPQVLEEAVTRMARATA